jgi:hypothetical protein
MRFEVIGMTVGKPDVAALGDLPALYRRDLVSKPSAAKISCIGVAEPGVRHQYGLPVERNQSSVFDGFHTKHDFCSRYVLERLGLSL